VTALLPVAGANFVPKAVGGDSQDRSFDAIVRGVKALTFSLRLRFT